MIGVRKTLVIGLMQDDTAGIEEPEGHEWNAARDQHRHRVELEALLQKIDHYIAVSRVDPLANVLRLDANRPSLRVFDEEV
jgi:hypothetical protein